MAEVDLRQGGFLPPQTTTPKRQNQGLPRSPVLKQVSLLQPCGLCEPWKQPFAKLAKPLLAPECRGVFALLPWSSKIPPAGIGRHAGGWPAPFDDPQGTSFQTGKDTQQYATIDSWKCMACRYPQVSAQNNPTDKQHRQNRNAPEAKLLVPSPAPLLHHLPVEFLRRAQELVGPLFGRQRPLEDARDVFLCLWLCCLGGRVCVWAGRAGAWLGFTRWVRSPAFCVV